MATIDKVKHALELYETGVSRYTLPSLDAPLEVGDDGGEVALGDVVADPGPSPEQRALEHELRELLARRMSFLDDREVAVFGLRFAGWSLADVSVVLGISAERVRQIEVRATRKIIAGEATGPAAPRPRPPARRAPAPRDPRRARMRELWPLMQDPALTPEQREEARAEYRGLAAELRAERTGALDAGDRSAYACRD